MGRPARMVNKTRPVTPLRVSAVVLKLIALMVNITAREFFREL